MKTPNDPRHLARKVAFSIIYAVESGSTLSFDKDLEDLIQTTIDANEITNFDKTLVIHLISLVKANSDQIHTLIQTHSPDWEVNKMYVTDRSVLILATAEILQKETPLKVIIDEAVELAKEFGQKDSPKFINGVLAGITKDVNNE